MSLHFPDSWREVVADTSAIINLNATDRAIDILGIFPSVPLVTESVSVELEAGRERGHRDFQRLEELVDSGSCRVVSVGVGRGIFDSLTRGRAQGTVGDGEAATIAYAATHGRAALMDDRKARKICAERFPNITQIYTVELLLHPCVHKMLGKLGQIDSIVKALREARMRVPPEFRSRVVGLIGEDRAARCPSLPPEVRGTVIGPG